MSQKTHGGSRALGAAGAALVASAITVVGLTAPASASSSSAAWRDHQNTLRAGHALTLQLKRPVKETCTLRIVSPTGKFRHRTYGAGKGRIQFDIAPPKTVSPGSWRFAATCVPSGTTRVQRTVTSLAVRSGGGTAFVVGRRGPRAHVITGSGATDPALFPVDGGKGGSGSPGDDYPAQWRNIPQDSVFDAWREYNRECTSFAAWRLSSRNGFNMPFFDHAYRWGSRAAALGYAVNNTPALGAVAWAPSTPRNSHGHVAWVADLQGSNVVIEEYNHVPGAYSIRTVTANSFQYITSTTW